MNLGQVKHISWSLMGLKYHKWDVNAVLLESKPCALSHSTIPLLQNLHDSGMECDSGEGQKGRNNRKELVSGDWEEENEEETLRSHKRPFAYLREILYWTEGNPGKKNKYFTSSSKCGMLKVD